MSNHIIGKVYDLTQENFNKVIRELEETKSQLATLQESNKALVEACLELKYQLIRTYNTADPKVIDSKFVSLPIGLILDALEQHKQKVGK